MILLFFLLMAALFVCGLVVIGEATRKRPGHPCCRRCDYELTGILRRTDRCPECGVELTWENISPPREVETHAAQVLIGACMVILSFPTCCLGSALLA